MLRREIFELFGLPSRDIDAEYPKLIDQPEYDPELDNTNEHEQYNDISSSDESNSSL